MAARNLEAAGRKELEHMPTIPHLLLRNPEGRQEEGHIGLNRLHYITTITWRRNRN